MSYIDPRPVSIDPADALLATPVDPDPRRPIIPGIAATIQHINSPFGRRLDADAVTAILNRRTNA